MHKIDTPTAVANLFDDGVPGTSDPTDLEAAWFNAVQEELIYLLTAAGVAPVKGTWTQVKTALDLLYEGNSIDCAVTPMGEYSGHYAPAIKPQFPWSDPTVCSNPATLPTGAATKGAWSPNGKYLCVCHATSPYITIYERVHDGFLKLANPGTLPTGTAKEAAWSKDGNYLAIAHTTTPFVTVYSRSGNTFTKLTNPGVLPFQNGNAVAWSNDGRFLAVGSKGGASTNDLTIYERSGSTLTNIALSGTEESVNSVCFSPNGRHLVATEDGSRIISHYLISGSTFTDVAVPSGEWPAAIPPKTCRFHPTGRYCYIGLTTGSTYRLAYFDFSSGAIDRVGYIYSSVLGEVDDLDWSHDGRYLAVTQALPDGLWIIEFDTSFGVVATLAAPDVPPAALPTGVAWSPDRQFLAYFTGTSPYVTIYRTSSPMPVAGRLRMRGIPLLS